MVQRKGGAARLKPQPPPKRTDAKSEKQSPSNPRPQRDDGRKGVIDLRMMLKKVRSIKLLEGDLLHDKSPPPPPPQQEKPSTKPSSSKKHPPAGAPSRPPNYMKPTSSSHARKEPPQVTTDTSSATAKNKNRSSKIPNSSNSSRPTSSSSNATAAKSSKTLMKRLSLRLMRPWMKSSAEVGTDVSRATCSSTLKDSKFPKTLELNQGGSESDGTSAMKVCPFTYCSLNGHRHRHEPLPPLRRVISVRRRMLKAQKSTRLKGLSSFKVKGLRKSKKEIDTKEIILTRVPSVALRAPLIQEVDDDFFVEIFAKPPQLHGQHDTEIWEALQGLSLMQGGEEHEKAGVISEYSSETSYEDEMDRYSELSVEEMDVVMEFLEYIERDQEAEAEEEEDLPCFAPGDYAEWAHFDCCTPNVLGKDGEAIAESIANLSTFESTDLDWEEEERSNTEDNNTDLCEFLDYGFGSILGPLLENENSGDGLPLEAADITLASCEGGSANAELPQDLISDVEEERIKIDVPSAFKDEISAMPNDLVNQLTDVLSPNSEPLEPVPIEGNVQDDANHKEGEDVGSIPDGEQPESEARETSVASGESLNDAILAPINEEMDDGSEEFVEYDDGNSMMKIQISDPSQAFYEIDLGFSEGTDEIMAPIGESITEAGTKLKARYCYIRRGTNEDLQRMRGFNPRAPRFLPELPDPEAEKVDLRHPEIDERKNAEDWMVDYALQRTVSRLARARSRKVRLFVEAFETVLQPPMCETPQQHVTMDQDQARRLQSCHQ